MILKYEAKINDNNKRLSDILRKELYISKRLLIKLKNGKCIFVNETPTNVDYLLKTNDKITVNLNHITKNTNNTNLMFYDMDLNILYEDNYLLIVDKPANMPVHPGASNLNSTLANVIISYYKKQKYNISTVHILTRLDTNTSGICLIAKNEYIQELFMQKKEVINLQKEYIAFVNNIIKNNHGFIIKNIKRDDDSIITRGVTENNSLGQTAKTEYFVLEKNINKNFTKIKITLHTGRTHQIRVHFASINHILLGDELYANKYDKTYSKICKEYINRQALHCYKLTFIHPINNKTISITADLPNDLKNI